MKCPLDNNLDCIALGLYETYPNDYPISPCKDCGMERLIELREKIAREENSEGGKEK